MPVNKKTKATEARKNAEVQKAKKKETRDTKTKAAPTTTVAKGGNKKPGSLIKQGKKK